MHLFPATFPEPSVLVFLQHFTGIIPFGSISFRSQVGLVSAAGCEPRGVLPRVLAAPTMNVASEAGRYFGAWYIIKLPYRFVKLKLKSENT